jgi:hypothetical protein
MQVVQQGDPMHPEPHQGDGDRGNEHDAEQPDQQLADEQGGEIDQHEQAE